MAVVPAQAKLTLSALIIRIVQLELTTARTEGVLWTAALAYKLHFLALISMNQFLTHGMK